jgi:hypothetical protein
MPQPRRVPESFIQLEPDLLIVTEYWDHLPPPSQSWIDARLAWVKDVLEDEPWKQWDQADWINALVFVGVGLAVLGNVATFIAEVRRASTVR